MRIGKVLPVLAMLSLFVSLAAAQTINFTINDSRNPVGTRHYIYHHVSGGNYSVADRKDAGTGTTYAWVGTFALGTHYFCSTAYVADGAATLESACSSDVTWQYAPQPPNSLTITSVTAQINRKDATLQAAANGPATMKFVYSAKGKTYTVIPTMVDNIYTAKLTKLTPLTAYSYQWQGTTTDGSVAVLDGSFITR